MDTYNTIDIIKSSGQKVKFWLDKLRNSLKHSGANHELVEEIVSKVNDEIYEGITTNEIYNRAYSLLKKNKSVFGKCSNPNFHGHNYELEVGITGIIDKETGFLIDMEKLKSIIKEEIEDYLDHKNLNIDISDFKDTNPTMENIAILIWDRLRNKLENKFKISVKLFETPRNFVVYNG